MIAAFRSTLLLFVGTALTCGCGREARKKEIIERRPGTPDSQAKGLPAAKRQPYSTRHWPSPDAPAESPWDRRFLEAKTPDEKIAIIVEKESSGPEHLASLIRRGLLGSQEEVRIQAIQSARSLTGAEAVDVLSGATENASHNIRILATDLARDIRPRDMRLDVFRNALASSDAEVRKMSAIELFRSREKRAIPMLLEGYALDDPDLVKTINSQFGRIANQHFDTFEEASAWWMANKDRFGDDLTERIPVQANP